MVGALALALTVNAGIANAKSARTVVALQHIEGFAQRRHPVANAVGADVARRRLPQRRRLHLNQHLFALLAQTQSNNTTIDFVLVAFDQAAAVEKQQTLRDGSLGDAEIFGQGLRRIAEAVRQVEIEHRLQMHRLEPFLANDPAHLRAYQVAQTLDQLQQRHWILEHNISIDSKLI